MLTVDVSCLGASLERGLVLRAWDARTPVQAAVLALLGQIPIPSANP